MTKLSTEERQAVYRALVLHNSTKAVAEALGVSKRTALRRLHELGVAVGNGRPRKSFVEPDDEGAVLNVEYDKLYLGFDGDTVRNQLFTLGAPTFGEEVEVADLETALVAGVMLSHDDATVSSVLSLVFFKQVDKLNFAKLVEVAKSVNEANALGFYLDLTTEVSGEQRFRQATLMLDASKSPTNQDFFPEFKSSFSRKLADMRTPTLARKWGFRMNMPTEVYEDTFKKHK